MNECLMTFFSFDRETKQAGVTEIMKMPDGTVLAANAGAEVKFFSPFDPQHGTYFLGGKL